MWLGGSSPPPSSKWYFFANYARYLSRNIALHIKYDLFTSFDSIAIDMIKAFFGNWLKDVFVFSNFGMFNSRVEVKPSSIEHWGNKEHFSITINRTDNQMIVVSLKKNQ